MVPTSNPNKGDGNLYISWCALMPITPQASELKISSPDVAVAAKHLMPTHHPTYSFSSIY